jgi:hypothetical protein
VQLDNIIIADVISPRPDGKLDLHGVGWDTIFAAAVPATHPRMDVAVRFLLSRHEVETGHHVTVEMQGADGHVVARLDVDTQPVPIEEREKLVPGRRIGVGLILNLSGLVFPEYGDYQLVITWDGTEVREPIQIFVVPLPFDPPAPAQ